MKTKKILSVFLALIIVLSTIPFAYAAENTVINEDEELAITIYNKGDSYILFTPERTGTYYIRALGAGLARCYIYNEENEYVCGSGEGESHGCCFRMYSELEAGVTYKLRIWSYSEQMDVVCIISCKHDYQLDESQSNPDKCEFIYTCSICEKQYTETKPCHADKNNDRVCDICGKKLNGYFLTEDESLTRYWIGLKDDIKDEVEELEFFYNTDKKTFDVYRNKILYFSYDISNSSLYNGNLTYYPQEEIHEFYPWEIMAIYVAQPGRMFVPPKPMTSEISTSDYWLSSNGYKGDFNYNIDSGIVYLIGGFICPVASYNVNNDKCSLSTWYYEMSEAIYEYEGKELDYTFEQVEEEFLYTFHDAINPPVPKSEGRSILVKKSADETVVNSCSQMYIETDKYLVLPTATVYNTEHGNYLLISLDETLYIGEKHGVYIESSKFESLLDSLSLKFYAPVAHVNEDGNKLCDICGDYVEFTIKCYLNSKEHQYAIENGYNHLIMDGPDYICNPTSGQCGDDVYWSFEKETGVLTISGTGAMYDFDVYSDNFEKCLPWYNFNYCIESVNIESGVTSIGNRAFYRCDRIKSVEIGNSVTSIGKMAFYNCCNLTSVTIPDRVTSIGDEAFEYCWHLTSITIPESVISIGKRTFDSCHNLKRVIIENGVKSIGFAAFEACERIEDVYYSGSEAQWNEIDIKEKNEPLLNATVHFNAKLADFTSGQCGENTYWSFDTETKTLTITGSGKMYDFNMNAQPWADFINVIETVIIEPGLTDISMYAFEDCKNLTSVAIPNSVTSIGYDAFYCCKSLTSIAIPDSVESIDFNAFQGCSSLTSIAIPDSVTNLGIYAFSGCRNLTSVTIGNGVKSIGEGTFEYCSSLTSVTIPDSVTVIGGFAFDGCTSLTSFTIPGSVTSIEYATFNNCSSLTSVTIPDSVTGIGKFAFYRCDNLTDVYYSGSEMQWNRIDIKDENDPLLDATVHFNDESDDTTSGQCGDNAYWSFDTETKTLTITGSGEMWDFTCIYEPRPHLSYPWIDFIDEIVTVIVEPGLTNIGGNAFNDCTNLTSVSLPDGITEIKFNAFENCKSLENIQLSESLISIGGFAFADCEKLENIQLPESLISIDQNAFSDCRRLKSIVIPEGVIRVDIDVFMNCFGLESVTIPSSLEYIPDIFSNCFSLKEIKVSENNPNYLDVDGVLFNKDKSELKIYPARKEGASYTIPSGVKRIAECAFGFNTNLKEVTVCDDVEELGRYAFLICLNLERLNLGEGIKKIGEDAFLGLFNLKNDIILNEGLEEIGDFAFEFLNQSEITIPSTVTSIGEKAFDSAAVDTIVNKSKVASLPLSDFYTSKQSRIMMNDFYKVLYQELYKDGYDGLEEKESKAFEAGVSYINEKYSTSFISTDDLIYYCKTDGSDKPYYNIVCYEDSVQHEVCIENGFTHSIIDSTCDDACGKHNIYTNDIMEPTCTENGYEGGVVCLDCEKIFEAATVIPATGHTPKTIKGVAPTCTSIGLTDGVYCETCGKIITAQEEIPALSHTDTNNDGVCDTCGEKYEDFEPEPILETFSQRIINFFKGIVDSILALFKRLFG